MILQQHKDHVFDRGPGLGDFDRAEPLLVQSLQLRQSAVRGQREATSKSALADQRALATACSDLGELYTEMGQYEKAEPLLSEALARDPALRATLRFQPNSSLYRAAGQLRYARARLDGDRRSYELVAIEPTDYLLATLGRAALGAG